MYAFFKSSEIASAWSVSSVPQSKKSWSGASTAAQPRFLKKRKMKKKFTGKGEAKNQKKTRKKRCQCIKVGVIFFCVCVIVFASSRRRTRAVGPLLKAKIVFFCCSWRQGNAGPYSHCKTPGKKNNPCAVAGCLPLCKKKNKMNRTLLILLITITSCIFSVSCIGEDINLIRSAQREADNTVLLLAPLAGHWRGYEKKFGCVDSILITLNVRSNSNRLQLIGQAAAGAASVSSAVGGGSAESQDTLIFMVTKFVEVSPDFWWIDMKSLVVGYTTASYFKAIVSINRDATGRPWRMRFAINGPNDENVEFRPTAFDNMGSSGDSFDLIWKGYLPGDNPTLADTGAEVGAVFPS